MINQLGKSVKLNRINYDQISELYVSALRVSKTSLSDLKPLYKNYFELGRENPSMAKIVKEKSVIAFNNEEIDLFCNNLNKNRFKDLTIVMAQNIAGAARRFYLRTFDKDVSTIAGAMNKKFNQLYPRTGQHRKKIIGENKIKMDRVVRAKY